MDISTKCIVSVASSCVGVVLVYHLFYKLKDVPSRKRFAALLLNKEERVDWLDDASFRAFAAICDTLIPSMSVKECSSDNVSAAMNSLCANFDRFPEVMTTEDALKFKNYLCAGALDRGTHRHCVTALEKTATREEKKQLSLVLWLLSTSVGNLVLTGYPVPFQDLPLKAREQVLLKMRDSRLDVFKTLFQTFKRLVCGVYLSFVEPGQRNPSWEALRYEPESAVRSIDKLNGTDEEKKYNLLRETVTFDSAMRGLNGKALSQSEDEWEVAVDAVVVGSGCGGGVVAHELVRAGYDVLVLEKGGFFQTDDFAKWKECEAFAGTFEKSGLLTTADGNIVVLAGACVGGGSTVNWSASFAPPRHVLEDWHREGLELFNPDNAELHQAVEWAKQLFGVNTDNSYHDACDEAAPKDAFAVNLNNRKLWKAAEQCGFTPQKIPRNVKKCVDCGHCTHGCSHASKQSTWSALLEPLILAQLERERQGATDSQKPLGKLHIIPNSFAQKVLFSDKKTTGVFATVTDPATGSQKRLRVKAKVVVSSCGSIHTPALLLRSGLKHRLIGKHLTLHPVLGCGGLLPKENNSGLASGVSMGVVVNNPPIFDRSAPRTASYSPERYPVAVETPPVHMGILGLVLPWESGLRFKIAALGWRQLALFLGISRDQAIESNRVEIDADGNPVLHYAIAEQDKANLLAGLEAQLRMMRTTGAPIVFYAHSSDQWFGASSAAASDAEFEAFIQRVRATGLPKYDVNVFSAHQMSSCRMASDASRGPVSPSGALFECDNLFVADGSVLPSSLGINPMLTIDAVALLIAKNVVAKLRASNTARES